MRYFEGAFHCDNFSLNMTIFLCKSSTTRKLIWFEVINSPVQFTCLNMFVSESRANLGLRACVFQCWAPFSISGCMDRKNKEKEKEEEKEEEKEKEKERELKREREERSTMEGKRETIDRN